MLLFRLKRFYQEVARTGERRNRKDRRRVSFPEALDFMRSGEYQLAATVQHEGPELNRGHYVATLWEGAEAGANCYREYRDDVPGASLAWNALPLERLQADAYVLVYVRTKFWSDRVGDRSERYTLSAWSHVASGSKAVLPRPTCPRCVCDRRS